MSAAHGMQSSAAVGDVRRSLSMATVVMMLSVFLSRVLGIVREQVLAFVAGAGSETDAYVAAFLLPDIVNHLIAGGVLSVTFIPIFHRHLAAGDEPGAWRAFSNIATCGTIVLWVLISLGLVFTPEFLGLMGERISGPDQLALTTRMTRIILVGQFFIYWGSLLMAVQYARKQFVIPAMAPLFYNVGIIAGGLVLGPRYGIEGFAWGVLAGAFFGNFVLQMAGAVRAGMDLQPHVDLRDPDLRTYLVLTLPLILGVGMQFSNEALFRIAGSFLNLGSIACLGYATKLFMMVGGLFGQAVSVASFPFLSQLVAEDRAGEMNRMAHQVMARMAVQLLPCAAVLAAVAKPVIVVLFQRGKFDPAASSQTALLLAVYLAGAYGFAATTVVSRCFYAMQNTLTPMIVSTVVTVASLAVYWPAAYHLEAAGVALAGAIAMNALFAVLLAVWLRPRFDRKLFIAFAATFGKALGAAAAGAALSVGIRAGLTALGVTAANEFWGNLMIVAIAGGLGLALAFGILEALGLVGVRAAALRLVGLLRRAFATLFGRQS